MDIWDYILLRALFPKKKANTSNNLSVFDIIKIWIFIKIPFYFVIFSIFFVTYLHIFPTDPLGILKIFHSMGMYPLKKYYK